MPRLTKCAILLASMVAMPTAAVFGGIISVVGDGNDRPIYLDDGQIGSNPSTNVVMGSLHGREVGSMWVFQLPALSAGETIAAADLRLTVDLDAVASAKFDMDLYAVDTRSSAQVITSDYTGGTLLQADFITDASTLSANDVLTTSATAASGLAAFLNNAYGHGTEGGDYAFLRLNTDWFGTIPSSGSSFLRIGSAENGIAAKRPSLTLTTVPEPAACWMLLVGVMGIIVWRRHR